MLLNKTEKLVVLHGPRFRSLEVALTELRWGAFESLIWLFGDRVYEARFRPKSGSVPPEAQLERRHEGRSSRGKLESASRPPRPLPEDFNVLCPCFSLAEVEAAAAESKLPRIVQAMFYDMLLNEMLELGVVHEYTAERMKFLPVGLRWSTFKVWMRIMDEVIRGAQLHLQPDEVELKGARDGQGEGSGSADPPAPSSDEE
ncbi:hypothetical protein Cgig2_019928 [Carnegiea gigantea]|uniref:Uncharacterized protein n=1 Tax=Carnegiea gigantea TaxID=171969 RepID=A0A9Q1KK07_9CARY|nr:hypothetical protein Cgig2_019928 [Carnegiea gigantea]